MKFSMALASVAVLLATSVTAFALTSAQKKELFNKGIITVRNEDGKKMGHYEVRFMPGAEHIMDKSKRAGKKAMKFMSELTDVQDFWKDEVVKSGLDGVDYVESSWNEGVGSVPEDYRRTVRKNADARGGFGSTAVQAKNWLGFGAKAMFRTLVTGVGSVFGAAYGVTVPLAKIALRPIAAATTAVVGGVVYPTLAFSWNGAAWVLTQHSNEPRQEDITVRWVPAR